MTWLQQYNAAKAREAEARRAAELAQQRAEQEAVVSQRELRQLVEESQRGRELVPVQHTKITRQAKALHLALSRDFDTTATDEELAQRLQCAESEVIAALAELVYGELVAVRVEDGNRRLMVVMV